MGGLRLVDKYIEHCNRDLSPHSVKLVEGNFKLGWSRTTCANNQSVRQNGRVESFLKAVGRHIELEDVIGTEEQKVPQPERLAREVSDVREDANGQGHPQAMGEE